MQKIAIIGSGIIGITLANYLDTTKYDITLFDEGNGQATKASAGIISPWLSKRRNKRWYRLAKDGAAFFQKLVTDMNISNDIYAQNGTILLRKNGLESLATLAEQRKRDAPEIGEIKLLSSNATTNKLPLLAPQESLYISGGARLDGLHYLDYMKKLAAQKQIHFISEKVTLEKENDHWQINTPNQQMSADRVVLAAGPNCKTLLEPLGYQVDLRPQKGQLIVFKTSQAQSVNWPVAMLDNEADLIPANNGQVIIGSTHENEEHWDLHPTTAAFEQLTTNSKDFLQFPESLLKNSFSYRVGTRAYTSDFAPFFGPLTEEPSLLVASGLGSSGLTTGPYIGYLLANYINEGTWPDTDYQKPLNTYIQK
ncbi:NAD(P)/FAD-dependent oxidoreductase [Tetragenococcus koreensis]|uniref:NAD(P)/FAD-dependent oxidoreductase n=1 Tax=Tetragenococcus koreensis TaxID=290335 RepID=UPI000F4E82F6|nr:FAD-dependent oxidoreductase [Tetragenococcus koreensis]AYW45429.1 FAD-dependent oxidoreductase [Tetragenococcus koreensis]GEN90541.1 oxidoreductase [Tetragenococcus koreensis]